MKKTIILIAVIAIIVIAGILFSMEKQAPSVDMDQQRAQERSIREGRSQVGDVNITNYTELRRVKMLYELRDDADLICYAYLYNERTGSVGQFLGKCMGYGIPAAVQISNPIKLLDDPYGSLDSGSVEIPQAEPNGLFMPGETSATWLMMFNEKNELEPVYVEPLIIVFPKPFRAPAIPK